MTRRLGLALALVVAAAACSGAIATTGGASSVDAGAIDASAPSGDGSPPDASHGADASDAGGACAAFTNLFPCDSVGSGCEPGAACTYAQDDGGCGTCQCIGEQDVGRFVCGAGENGCPTTAPAPASACIFANWSCALSDDAGCPITCACEGSPVGAWTCTACSSGDAGGD